jgi:hypothetical protein
MTRKEKLREIFSDLKDGLRFCVVERHENFVSQGKSFSCDWNGHWSNSYIYFRNYGSWAHAATLANLAYELEGVDLNDVITESEYEKLSKERFFGWRI